MGGALDVLANRVGGRQRLPDHVQRSTKTRNKPSHRVFDLGRCARIKRRLVELDYIPAMSELMADCHGSGQMVYAKINELHENTADLFVARCTFLAMVRIRILEQRITDLTAELQRLEAVTRGCY